MSIVETVLGVAAIMAWLASGGYAFAVLGGREDLPQDQIGVLFGACLIIAPFMAALALVYRRHQP